MAFRRGGWLSAPSLGMFIVSIVLAGLAIASLYMRIPTIGHYVNAHRFWILVAAYAVLALGVVLPGL